MTKYLQILIFISFLSSYSQKREVMYQAGEEVKSVSKGEKETKLETLRFFDENAILEESTSKEDISEIVDKINAIFFKLFKNSPKEGKLMIEITLSNTEKAELKFAVRDDLDLDLMKEFEQLVLRENFPKSRKHKITMQLIYKVNSYNDKY